MDKRKMILLCLVLLLGCNYKYNSKQEKDTFYSEIGGFDWIRIPLLKPYAAEKIDPEIETHSWIIKFQSDKLYNTYNVKRVAVEDSIVYVLSGTVDEKKDTTIIGTRNVPTAWFVMDVRKKTERGFENEKEFSVYLKENDYPLPHWYGIDSLSNELGRGKELPWHQRQ